jgi:nicotinamide-nucleotide amidase
MNQLIEQLVIQLSEKLKARDWKLTTAESCTGGGLAYHLTHVPGSSSWFERGFVTYSNQAKEELLGVNPSTLTQFGAVSEETAREMAEGALRNSQAQASIAITGIGGPDGGSKEKPVGTIWIGYASINSDTHTHLEVFSGTREQIREQTIKLALEIMNRRVD